MPALSNLFKRKDAGAKDKKKVKGEKGYAAPVDDTPPPPPMPGDEFALPTREVVRPDNQLALSDLALAEEIPRMLTAYNPAAPKNVARFNMKERAYKFEPMVEQTIQHYGSDGWLLHKGSDDARKQVDTQKAESEASAKFTAEVEKAAKEKEAGGDAEAPDDSRQLRNQFNFSERAAQTFNYPLRHRETMTEPPPTATVSGSCSMWEIYDEYCRDFERQRAEEASKSKPGAKKGGAAAAPAAGAPGAAAGSASSSGSSQALAKRAGGRGSGTAESPLLNDKALQHSLHILDRMANQNMYAEIAADFKYWEDTSDAFRPGEGSLLPLWRFPCPRGTKNVTSLCWSPLYTDLFAVGYGSYHFLKQGGGLVAIWSLKNPTHPELTLTLDSGVMALHFHPEFANLLAVGCYDGSVAVFDVRDASGKPLYQANVKTGKHSDPVWQVCWQVDEMQRALQFVSISSDGNVVLWTLTKSELQQERLMRLQPQPQQQGQQQGQEQQQRQQQQAAELPEGDDGHVGLATAGGLCMDFNKAPGQDNVYLVGTEEGAIHQCSKAYSSEYLATYSNSHAMAVYAVKWNLLHPRMFLSASADWRVKLWDAKETGQPLLAFDLGAAVGDVAWAPHSATTFAAVTDDGKVHVYDLAENRQVALCTQKVSKKARLSKVAFNPKHPIMLVGDSKGNVCALKLSPNLRHSSKPAAGQKLEDLERDKLDAVIAVARKSQAAAAAGAEEQKL